MTINAIVLVVIALCVRSPLCGSLAAASPVSPPVANKLLFGIVSNDAICQVKNIIVESRYVKSCNDAKLPTDQLNLTAVDTERFLCLGVYDRIATLCYLDSLKTGGKPLLPGNSTEFDNLVAKLPPTDEDSYEFCKRPKNPYPPRYEKTKKYAEQLNQAMSKSGLCLKMCIHDDASFNRLCSVIAAIEDISLRVVRSSDRSPTQDTEDTTAKGETIEHAVKAEGAVEKTVPKKSKESTGKTEEKAAPKPSADKEEADKNKKQSETLPEPQPKHAEPAPEITKPAALSPPTAPKEASHIEKVKKIEEPETAVKPSQPGADAAGGDKKVDIQPPSPKSPPIVPDTLAISGEDGSDGYFGGTDNISQALDDPTNGEISEHTQNQEDQDVGEETSELGERNNPKMFEATLNELDPPPIPPNEQVEESLPGPSEKRDFVPRMPSIRNDDDSHFFGYFTIIGVICIAGYVGYHNKQKILAMVLEGRRSRGGRGRRRPSTANYRKLDCTLEEAVTSQCNSNVTHVIY